MVESGHLPVEGGQLYYEVEGSGPPLTLVHAGVANLRQWDADLHAFAERHRVIRYDTRGFGRTTTEDVGFSNRDDLGALLDHLGVVSTALLGASRGGMIALDFALEYPGRVDTLVIVAGGVGGYDAPDTPEELAIFEELDRRDEARDFDYLTDAETALWVDGPGQPADRVAPALRHQVRDWIAESYRDHGDEEPEPRPLRPPAHERLEELTVPTLVIVGDLDTSGTQAACRHLAERVRGARLEVFSGAAHMVNLEQPDRFREVVLGFLAQAAAENH